MLIASLIITLAGAGLSLAGSAWLFLGFRPDDKRYTDEGMLYPGPQSSRVVSNLLRDQRRPAALVVAGGSLQLIAGVVALVAST